MKISYSLLLPVLATVLPTSMLEAAAPKPNATFQPMITAVDKDGLTVLTGRQAGVKLKIDGVTQAPSNNKMFRVNQSTTITIDGLPGTLDQLKQGMAVRVVAGLNRDTAASIVANNIAKPLPTPKSTGKNSNVPQGAVIGTRVLTVTSNTITVANPGSKATAYVVTANTVIRVNGVIANLSAIHEGMLAVISSNGQISTNISAQDTHDPVLTKLKL